MKRFVFWYKVFTMVFVSLALLAIMGIVTYTIGWQNGFEAYEEQLRLEQRLYEELPDDSSYYYHYNWDGPKGAAN